MGKFTRPDNQTENVSIVICSVTQLFIIQRFMAAICKVKCAPSNFICGLTEVAPLLEWVVYHL